MTRLTAPQRRVLGDLVAGGYIAGAHLYPCTGLWYRISVATLNVLIRLDYLHEEYVRGVGTLYSVTDAGRAAWAAGQEEPHE